MIVHMWLLVGRLDLRSQNNMPDLTLPAHRLIITTNNDIAMCKTRSKKLWNISIFLFFGGAVFRELM